MHELGLFLGYKCMICKHNIKWKKYSKWIEKHFNKYHRGEKIYLKKIYKNGK